MDFSLIFSALFFTSIIFLWLAVRKKRQISFIQNYQFHDSIKAKVSKQYPHLSNEQLDLVFDGLRTYFYICNKAKRKTVAMPSQVVDIAWHEFIIFTKAYERFSQKAIGRFLHHTPTEAMRTPTLAQEGIKRAWRLSCVKEQINPQSPIRLPLLFAIDGLLEIEDGYHYSLDCQNKSDTGGTTYCAGAIGCSSGCAGGSGSTTGCSASSCGSGCGGD